jgi:hypothetical protein
MTNPNLIAAMEALGATPEMAQLRTQVWELSQRLEDLAAYVATHLRPEPVDEAPPPVAEVLAAHFGVCDHGRLLRDPCPDCRRRSQA